MGTNGLFHYRWYPRVDRSPRAGRIARIAGAAGEATNDMPAMIRQISARMAERLGCRRLQRGDGVAERIRLHGYGGAVLDPATLETRLYLFRRPARLWRFGVGVVR